MPAGSLTHLSYSSPHPASHSHSGYQAPIPILPLPQHMSFFLFCYGVFLIFCFLPLKTGASFSHQLHCCHTARLPQSSYSGSLFPQSLSSVNIDLKTYYALGPLLDAVFKKEIKTDKILPLTEELSRLRA